MHQLITPFLYIKSTLMNRASVISVPLDQNINPQKVQTQELLVQHWYRLAFMPSPYRSLLVKVRCQLQEPGGFNSCHISHVVFSSLDDFIVYYPERKETKMNSVCCQAMRES